MKVRRFHDADDFARVAVPALEVHEAENNLPLGIIETLAAGDHSYGVPFLATVHGATGARADTVSAIAVRTPPFPVVVALTPDAANPDVVSALVQALRATYGEDIGGFNADARVVNPYVEAWSECTGHEPVVHMRTRIYTCVDVKPVPNVSGGARAALPRDRDILQRLVSEFFQEALPDEYDPQRVRDFVERSLAADPSRRGLLLWETDGTAVSMAGYTGPTPHGIRVNAVYTPPQYRRRGYASACVAALTDKLLRAGREFCFLFTDLSNPTSNKIYQGVGYRPVSDHASWKFVNRR